MSEFLTGFQGGRSRWGVSGFAYLCFVMTMAFNTWILSGGIRRGIERAASWGMPVLILLSVLLTIRVLTLGAPDPSQPENHVRNSMGFIWNPDLSRLTDAKVWLAAAGQIFFTLSVGFSTIQVYASYLRSRDDVVVTGHSTTMVNQWGVVFLPVHCGHRGHLIPAGLDAAAHHLPARRPQMEPAKGRARDLDRDLLGGACAHPASGALDEIDFWAGTFGVTLFAFIETIMFV